MADMSVIRRLKGRVEERRCGSGGGYPSSVCAAITLITPHPHQDQGHTTTRGDYLVDTLTLTYY